MRTNALSNVVWFELIFYSENLTREIFHVNRCNRWHCEASNAFNFAFYTRWRKIEINLSEYMSVSEYVSQATRIGDILERLNSSLHCIHPHARHSNKCECIGLSSSRAGFRLDSIIDFFPRCGETKANVFILVHSNLIYVVYEIKKLVVRPAFFFIFIFCCQHIFAFDTYTRSLLAD